MTRRIAPVCGSSIGKAYSLGVRPASITPSPLQADAATSRSTNWRSLARSAARLAALPRTLVTAASWAWTRRLKSVRPMPPPRVSTSRLTAFVRPWALRPICGAAPPIETRRSAGSAETVWYQSLLKPAAPRAATSGARNHSSAALVTKGGMLAVPAYCSSTSKRCTAPKRLLHSAASTGYSCRSSTTSGARPRTSSASACASGVRSSRWSRLRSTPSAAARWPRAAPSGLARGSR